MSLPDYICLWESRSMPGIIQLGRAAAGEESRAWTLRSPAGEARFRVTHRMATHDAAGVEARLKKALRSDAIRHHDGFYSTPKRFALQLLDREARGTGTVVSLRGRRARRVAATLLALIGIGTALHWPSSAARQVHRPAYRNARITMR